MSIDAYGFDQYWLIKSIGLNWLSYPLLEPCSLKVTMRVTESNGGKKVLLAPPRWPGFLLSPYSPGYRTFEVEEVVYSLAENKTDISTWASSTTILSWPETKVDAPGIAELQRTLDNMINWADKWGMQFKCNVMHLWHGTRRAVGWSDITLFGDFRKRYFAADQLYFYESNSRKLATIVARAAKF